MNKIVSLSFVKNKKKFLIRNVHNSNFFLHHIVILKLRIHDLTKVSITAYISLWCWKSRGSKVTYFAFGDETFADHTKARSSTKIVHRYCFFHKNDMWKKKIHWQRKCVETSSKCGNFVQCVIAGHEWGHFTSSVHNSAANSVLTVPP